MKHLPSLILFLVSSSILSATTGLIDDYYLGFSYSYTKAENDYSSNGPNIFSNFAVHPNISIGAGLAYRNGNAKARNIIYQGVQLSEQFDDKAWIGDVGIVFHNRFEPSDTLAIYPFVGFAIAARSIEVEGSLTNQFGYSAPWELDYSQFLYRLALGTQFLINDFFVLSPALYFVDYMDDGGVGGSSSFGWSLAGVFLFTDHFSSGLTLGGGDGYTTISLGTAIHF
jgi:hypothetical protein